jgi:iron complex outermembrane receptor protein
VLGFYVNDKITVNPKTKISINGRVDAAQSFLKEGIGKDQIEVFYPDVSNLYSKVVKSFNVKLNRLIGNSLIVDLGIGYGERMPTISEMFGFYLFNRMDGYDYVGNPNLKSETNFSGEVTLNYYRNKFQLSASGFYNQMPDYIYSAIQPDLLPMTPGANGVKIYSNISYATILGGEASLLYSLTQSLQFITTWKYSKGQNDEGVPLPMMPPLLATSSLRYSLKSISVQLENEMALQQDRVNPLFGEDYTSGYSIMNFRTSYVINFRDKRLELNVGVENMFDKKYHNHLDWGNISRPGRNITASVSFSF